MVVPFSVQILPFYRQKPNLQDPGKIGGANAPPNSLTKPRKRGFGRVSAARVWPGGHTLLVGLPGISFFLYLGLDLQFSSEILKKWPLIFTSTDRFWEDSSQPVFNVLILPWFTEFELIQNLVGFWAHFSSLSLRNGSANKLTFN